MYVFVKQLRKAMAMKGWRQADLAKATGFSDGQISSWYNERFRPNAENMAVIASALGVSVDFLLGKEVDYAVFPRADAVMETGERLSGDEKIIIEAFRGASDEQKRLVRYLLGLKNAQEGP